MPTDPIMRTANTVAVRPVSLEIRNAAHRREPVLREYLIFPFRPDLIGPNRFWFAPDPQFADPCRIQSRPVGD